MFQPTGGDWVRDLRGGYDHVHAQDILLESASPRPGASLHLYQEGQIIIVFLYYQTLPYSYTDRYTVIRFRLD